ncbi:unnamed protein product, partial [Didymodactylos carnosus]
NDKPLYRMLFTKEKMLPAQSPFSSQCSRDEWESEQRSWSVSTDREWRELLDDQGQSIYSGGMTPLAGSLSTPPYCASPSNSITSGHQQQQVEPQPCSLPPVPVSDRLPEELNGSSFDFPLSIDGSALLPRTPTTMLSPLPDIADWLVIDGTTKRKRRPYLHEFLRRLLDNPKYHNLATYINPQEGIFKLHKPDTVTDLWQYIKGRKSEKRMTYDNFARGIRYYYPKEVMMANSGQKFTFRFGPQSGFGELWKPRSQ